MNKIVLKSYKDDYRNLEDSIVTIKDLNDSPPAKKEIFIDVEDFCERLEHLLVCYAHVDNKENLVKVGSGGQKIFMVDLMIAKEGEFQVGVIMKEQTYVDNKGKTKSYGPRKKYRGGRARLTIFNYNTEEFVCGSTSENEITWVKTDKMKVKQLFGVFFCFDEDPGEVTIWCQGPSIVGLESPKVDEMHFDIAKESLLWYIEQSCFNIGTGQKDLEYLQIDNQIVKTCFKILPNGYGVLLLKNYTTNTLSFQIELKKKEEISFCIFSIFIYSIPRERE